MIQMTEAEYQKLAYARDKLQALEAAGVVNWDGYDYAMQILNDEEETD